MRCHESGMTPMKFRLTVLSLSRTLVPLIVHNPPFWAIDPGWVA
jgi:hypothetical protein